MEILNTLFYFILTIGVLVLVHELGHFMAAKFFGMRVDRFSIGFPPRAFGKTIGETDYCISWIPIGGYVKIAGMIDESFDTDFVSKEPQPWEFRSKPAWQRTIVLAGGVIMNLILAWGIFWGITYFEGKTVWLTTEVGFVAEKSAAAGAGFEKGDKVLSVNGVPVKYWDEIEAAIYVEEMGKDLLVNVDRGGTVVSIPVARDSIPSLEESRFGVFPTDVVPVVETVDAGKPAGAIGIRQGDIIVSVEGKSVDYYTLSSSIQQRALKETELQWRRGGEMLTARVTPTEEGRIGISLRPRYTGPSEKLEYSVFGAMGQAVKEMVNAVSAFIKNIQAIIAGSVSLSESVGGPVKIAQIATRSAEAGLSSFLTVMAWLSLTLAILNLLPFPALDGGHLVFVAYEGIFRKEIPTRVKIILQQAGFALLLVFMAFVLYNDIVNY